MPCAPRALLLRDLVLGVVGTGAFLVDLGADLWAASRYVLGGCYVCAALVLGLTGLASGALQLFSWLWLRADPAGLHVWRPPGPGLALLHLLQLGYLYRASWCGDRRYPQSLTWPTQTSWRWTSACCGSLRLSWRQPHSSCWYWLSC